MRSDRKQTILFIIILLVLSMGIGYAFLTTTLNIDGTSDIDSASWDVHWENASTYLSTNISSEQILSAPAISNNGTAVSYHVKLNEPGDRYVFKVDAVNAGSLDAVIEDITITVNGVEDDFPPYIIHGTDVFSSTQLSFGEGLVLWANSYHTYLFGIMYDPNVDAADLPTDDISLNVSYQITYSQFSHQPNYNNMYVYSLYGPVVGESLPAGMYFDNPQAALNNFWDFSFIRFYISDNIVSTSELGVKINGNIYYFKGGDNGAAYETNKALLQTIFSSTDCVDQTVSYSCSRDNIRVEIDNTGDVEAILSSQIHCSVTALGSECFTMFH